MTTGYRSPRLLESADDVSGFACRSAAQTRWLRRFGRQVHGTGTTRVSVVTPADSAEVVAYYAWCMASISPSDAPDRLRVGAGKYPQPVALLARLGVSTSHEGQGLGAGLLADVMQRASAAGRTIGCRGLLVHAESDDARAFCLHLIPEFEPSPTDPLHLLLVMKDIRRTSSASG